MKRLLVASSCLSLLFAMVAPSISAAQNTNAGPSAGRPGGGNPSTGRPGGGGPSTGRPGGGGNPSTGRPGGGNPSTGRPGGGNPSHPSNPGHRPPHHNPGHKPPNHHPGHKPPHHHPGYKPPHHHPGYRRPYHHPGYRPVPLRPNWGWNGHRYHAAYFRYPPGYAYRRWAVGATLPFVFLSATYYVTNYAVMGFEAPPPGFQWVRYGPDILLVNITTGEVAAVQSGVATDRGPSRRQQRRPGPSQAGSARFVERSLRHFNPPTACGRQRPRLPGPSLML